MMRTSKNQMLSSQKNYIKMQIRVQFFSFFPVDVKKSVQKIGIKYGLFYQIVKTKQTIFGET